MKEKAAATAAAIRSSCFFMNKRSIAQGLSAQKAFGYCAFRETSLRSNKRGSRELDDGRGPRFDRRLDDIGKRRDSDTHEAPVDTAQFCDAFYREFPSPFGPPGAMLDESGGDLNETLKK